MWGWTPDVKKCFCASQGGTLHSAQYSQHSSHVCSIWPSPILGSISTFTNKNKQGQINTRKLVLRDRTSCNIWLSWRWRDNLSKLVIFQALHLLVSRDLHKKMERQKNMALEMEWYRQWKKLQLAKTRAFKINMSRMNLGLSGAPGPSTPNI